MSSLWAILGHVYIVSRAKVIMHTPLIWSFHSCKIQYFLKISLGSKSNISIYKNIAKNKILQAKMRILSYLMEMDIIASNVQIIIFSVQKEMIEIWFFSKEFGHTK